MVVYVINHRSNADYVLVSYALAGDVSISYAVGEWARAFPLEYVFKSFGFSSSFDVSYREPLYHTVLEQYVQLITRNGVTQGIFPEGGLTRDGTCASERLDSSTTRWGSHATRTFAARRLTIIPVALNYDRVLEDRSLLRELGARANTACDRHDSHSSVRWRVTSARTLVRLGSGRWKRYGRAAVTIGRPTIPVAQWLATVRERGPDLSSSR